MNFFEKLKYEKIVEKIKEDGYNYFKLKEKYLTNEKLALLAIKTCPKAIERVGANLRKRLTFLLSAIECNPDVYLYFTKEGKSNKNLVLQAIKKGLFFITHVPSEFYGDYEVMRCAGLKNPSALAFADFKIIDDPSFMEEIIMHKNSAIIHASERLKNDKEFILRLLDSCDGCIICYSLSLQNDEEVVMKAVEKNPYAARYISQDLLLNDAFMEKLKIILKNAKHIVMTDKEKVRQRVIYQLSNDGLQLQNMSEELQNDKDVVFAALRNAPSAWEYVPEQLKQNDEFIVEAFYENNKILPYLSPEEEKLLHGKILKSLIAQASKKIHEEEKSI